MSYSKYYPKKTQLCTNQLQKFNRRRHDLVNRYGVYVPLVVSNASSFPHSRLITGFITSVMRWVPLVEQELPTLPEHLSLPPVLNGVCVIRSLVLYVMFCRSLFFLLSFLFWPLCSPILHLPHEESYIYS